jgi:hypothetical protein
MILVFQCTLSHTDTYVLTYCKLEITLNWLTRETSELFAEVTSSETLSCVKCQSNLPALKGLMVNLRDIPLRLQLDTFKPRLMAAFEKCLGGEGEAEYSMLSLKGEIFCTTQRFKAKSKDSIAS